MEKVNKSIDSKKEIPTQEIELFDILSFGEQIFSGNLNINLKLKKIENADNIENFINKDIISFLSSKLNGFKYDYEKIFFHLLRELMFNSFDAIALGNKNGNIKIDIFENDKSFFLIVEDDGLGKKLKNKKLNPLGKNIGGNGLFYKKIKEFEFVGNIDLKFKEKKGAIALIEIKKLY